MREIPDGQDPGSHPIQLGYLQPGWRESGLTKKERPPVDDLYCFANKAEALEMRTLFQGEGRRTRIDRKTIKFDGLSIMVYVLVIRRVE